MMRRYTPATRYAEAIQFDSVEDLLNEDYSADRIGARNAELVRGLWAHPADWFGLPRGLSHKEAAECIERYAREGSPELANKIRDCFREMRSAIKITATRRKKVKTQADFGTEVQMERVYAGDLDKAWRSSRRIETASNRSLRRIVIAVSVGGTSDIPPEELFWQGATACFLAEELMTAGYTVGVVAYSAAFGSNHDWRGAGYVVGVTIKKFQNKTNMAAIAGCLGCPGFFRWLILRSRSLFGFRLSWGFGGTDHSSALPPEAMPDTAEVLQLPVIRSLHQARRYLGTAVEQLKVGVAT